VRTSAGRGIIADARPRPQTAFFFFVERRLLPRLPAMLAHAARAAPAVPPGYANRMSKISEATAITSPAIS
jgi:hypothetical protein